MANMKMSHSLKNGQNPPRRYSPQIENTPESKDANPGEMKSDSGPKKFVASTSNISLLNPKRKSADRNFSVPHPPSQRRDASQPQTEPYQSTQT
jgi:hypothetical protein